MLATTHSDIYNDIQKYTREIPANNMSKVILFEGPPGTGKTASAKIISQ